MHVLKQQHPLHQMERAVVGLRCREWEEKKGKSRDNRREWQDLIIKRIEGLGIKRSLRLFIFELDWRTGLLIEIEVELGRVDLIQRSPSLSTKLGCQG